MEYLLVQADKLWYNFYVNEENPVLFSLFSEECEDLTTNMLTTSLTLSTNDTSPTPTTIWEALLGTGTYYYLPATTTVIEAVFSAVDEPLIKYVTFKGENIGDVVVKVTRKDGSDTAMFLDEVF